MLISGDVVDLNLGLPTGSEADIPRPAVIVSAQEILDRSPSVIKPEYTDGVGNYVS